MKMFTAAAFAVGLMSSAAYATDLEVTHWWTSGGESAAVAEFAKAFEANSDNKWIDAGIAGGSGAANPVIISRILGGDPMGATQMNTGRDAEELIEAGLMLDITDIVEETNFIDSMSAPQLMGACEYEGRYYCLPVNIHSWQWMWVSHGAYEKAGLAVPANWNEFVASAPELREAGVIPLAMGQQPWQTSGAFGVILVGLQGADFWRSVYVDRDMDVIKGDAMASVFKAYSDARAYSEGSNVQDWNQATNLVITGAAGAQIMGDWAQGEFAVAGQVAGEDYECLPGLGLNEVLDTGGDAFYFPKQSDAAVEMAQKELARIIISPETQVSFNLKKGSLPIRKDVNLDAANDCMKKGLAILQAGGVMPSGEQVNSSDTEGQLDDLFVEFWNTPSMTPEQAHERFASIMESAD